MTVTIEVKGIDEIRERLSKMDINAMIQDAMNQTAAKIKEDMRKPSQRKRPIFLKETGELQPSIRTIEGDYESR